MENKKTSPCHYIFKNVEFTKLTFHNFDKLYINLFYSKDYSNSEIYIKSLEGISEFYDNIIYTFIDVEKNIELVKAFDVEIIPSIIISNSNKKIIKKIDNSLSISNLIVEMDEILKTFQLNFDLEKKTMFDKIEKILKSHAIMVFIKGIPTNPKCGFTSSLLEIIKSYNLNFGYYNILDDEDVRNWLRFYSKWNTYPQLYINAKLIGGLDVIKELIKNNKFKELLPNEAYKSDPSLKLQRLCLETKDKVLLFIEGMPNENNKKTQEIIQILKDTGVKFNFNNVKEDKEFLNYLQDLYKKDFPLVFINGIFIGVIDDIQKLHSEKKLLDLIPINEWSLNSKQKIDYLVSKFNIVCFIEGNIDNLNEKNQKFINILHKNNVQFQYFNVLSDGELKNLVIEKYGFNEFPQIIFKNKLIGGLNVIEEIEKEKNINELFNN